VIRDRDSIYGLKFQRRIKGMGMQQVVIAPRSPWQNAFVERVIGSIRRECLNHMIVLNEQHLRKILHDYFEYYNESRTHLSLNKRTPIISDDGEQKRGNVAAFPRVGAYITIMNDWQRDCWSLYLFG
jgi:transposase InsO family protein